jgi:concanavalin A-like lectin/glucanase superfamily protein
MSSVHVLYDRPDLDQPVGADALYVTGTLAGARPSAVYEGRLQIHNSIGMAKARQIDGDTLPPGASITVDQTAMEVVINWPPYSVGSLPIENPSFESGSSTWELGTGIIIRTDDGTSSEPQVRTGTMSMRYDGTGKSVAKSTTYYVCPANLAMHISGYVKQGASDSHAVGCNVGIEFYDANKNVLAPTLHGNVIDSSSGSNFQLTEVSGTSPAGTAFARPIIEWERTRQNKPAWFDDIEWNLQGTTLGSNVARTYAVTIQVDDAVGRSAVWSGVILISDGDPFFSDVVLLTHYENPLSNTSWSDVVAPHNYARVGTAALSTARFKFGTKSLALNSDYAELVIDGIGSPIEGMFSGAQPFTVETWYYMPSATTDAGVMYFFTGSGFVMNIRSNKLRVESRNSVVPVVQSSLNVPKDQWVHLAYERYKGAGDTTEATYHRLFINGVMSGNVRNTTIVAALYTAGTPLQVGGGGGDTWAQDCFIDETRITRTSRYTTAGFTPPTEAYPDS